MASFVPAEATALVDVGYDHGLLLASLRSQRPDLKLLGVECLPDASERFRKRFGDLGVTLRYGYGLAPVAPGEVDTVVLAGLSDRTIVEVLDGAQPHWPSLKTVICCPAMVEAYLRPGLRERGFRVLREDLVFEAGRSYDVIVATLGQPRDVPEPWQRWGPALYEEGHPRLLEHLKGRRHTMRRAFKSPDFAGYRDPNGELLPMGKKLAVLDQLIAELDPQ